MTSDESSFPKLSEMMEIDALNDPSILHFALFDACRDLVGTKPPWNPRLEFKKRYEQALIDYKAMMDNPCCTGLILEEEKDGQD